MANNPPRRIGSFTVEDLRDNLAVDVDEVTKCDGGSECLRERPIGPEPVHGGDAPTESYFPYTTIKAYDKWFLQQCKECGGVSWLHNARADYGGPDRR